MPFTSYTEEEYCDMNSRYVIAMNILSDIFKSFSYEHSERFNKKGKDVHYPFIPQSGHEVLNHFRFLNQYIKNKKKDRNESLKFLDVGCGIGNILLFANKTFRYPFQAYGIERDKKMSMAARQFVNDSYDDYIYNMDAFNFKKYKEYDIIYYYCPIADHELQQKLELLIEKKMKVGAYLMPFLKQDINFISDGKFKRIDKDYKIYVKKK